MNHPISACKLSGTALAAALLCAPALALAAAPTSGAYVTDPQNTWVQDRVGDRISTVNMIMCVMSSLRPDAMVNQGPYVALVDENKCQGRGDSSKSGSTNAGASNASSYMSGTVDATQASANDPLVAKIWLHQEESDGNGGTNKVAIYAYITATAAPSATNPNGLFSMYFCGVPEGQSSCMFKGTLKSDSSGMSFYQEESGGGGGPAFDDLVESPIHLGGWPVDEGESQGHDVLRAKPGGHVAQSSEARRQRERGGERYRRHSDSGDR